MYNDDARPDDLNFTAIEHNSDLWLKFLLCAIKDIKKVGKKFKTEFKQTTYTVEAKDMIGYRVYTFRTDVGTFEIFAIRNDGLFGGAGVKQVFTIPSLRENDRINLDTVDITGVGNVYIDPYYSRSKKTFRKFWLTVLEVISLHS